MFPDFTPRPHLVAAAAAPHRELVAAAADHLDDALIHDIGGMRFEDVLEEIEDLEQEDTEP